MHALRHSRGIGRFLAAWLLLWFVAMAASPLPLPHQAGHAKAGHVDESRAACAGHHAHAGHAPQACAGADDLYADGNGDAANPSHCPVCLHVAAPPSPPLARMLPDAAPGATASASFDTQLRIRTAAPPPARGPPQLS